LIHVHPPISGDSVEFQAFVWDKADAIHGTNEVSRLHSPEVTKDVGGGKSRIPNPGFLCDWLK
jgi:hypothetical protein